MKAQRRPYLGAVAGFALWIAFCYMTAVGRFAPNLPLDHLLPNVLIYLVAGGIFGWVFWRLVLCSQWPTWVKGALLTSM